MHRRVTRRMTAYAMALALGAGCGHRTAAPTGPAAPLDATIRLAVGDSVTVGDGLRLAFTEVPADSRCPVDVACVWEGDATVRLSADPPSGPPRTLDLHTGGAVGGREAAVDGFRVRLEGLEPVPRAGVAIPPASYVALVRVLRD